MITAATRRSVVLTLLTLSPLVSIGGTARTVTAQEPSIAQITLLVSHSTVLTTDFDVTRIAITNPEIANATVVRPREILIDGRAAGRVSLIVWGDSRRVHYEVAVEGPGSALQQQIQSLFPGEDIRLIVADDAIMLSGRVSNPDVMVRALDIVQAAAPKSRVVNLLQLPGVATSQQVMLEVRFAEVSRRALTELGVSFFTGPSGFRDFVGRTSTQQFAAPDFVQRIGPPPPTNPTDEGQFTFSDFLNLFIFNTEHNVGALIRALKARGFFQSLAEPNLIAYNGQEASFLAGGEIPVPIVQGVSGAVSVTYKEFGIRLTFRPTIAGDVIRLRVRPEVSSLDFANGVTVEGFRIPALSTRRAETEVELRNGQSFAIAGLMDNSSQDDRTKIPILGDIPIVGHLFRSRADRVQRTELMVLITPRLVRPLEAGEVPQFPLQPEKFLPPDEKRVPAAKPPKGEGRDPCR